jgi:hypothetical protein
MALSACVQFRAEHIPSYENATECHLNWNDWSDTIDCHKA